MHSLHQTLASTKKNEITPPSKEAESALTMDPGAETSLEGIGHLLICFVDNRQAAIDIAGHKS